MSRRGVFKGLIIILLGLMLLANNFRILPWGVWHELFRLWPVVLIAIGTHLIFRKSSLSYLQIIPPLTIIAAIVGAIYLSQVAVNYEKVDRVLRFEEPLSADLTRATIRISFGAGRLRLEGGSAHLFEGDLVTPSWLRPKMRYKVVDREGFLELTEEGRRGKFRFGAWGRDHSWNLKLNNEIPLALRIETAASRNDLDLSASRVTDLELDIGASKTEIKFSDSVSIKAKIDGGVSQIRLLIPRSMATRIKAETALTSSNVLDVGFRKDGNVYTSKNYPTAQTRLDLDLDVGVSSFRVELYE
ncbi:hypothetical protein E3J48_08720 [Candidatus Aerophobetes bacterium]|uniref:DUF5668 domain-containing protein n=1 Tax=Aerophobetes bacterium TaxID=2030807 RepID=A0A523VV64_UNCAE|nr:MAG: hypothetical protein E3J48_08720 [Candidatus Aerophobetes bacterium]